MAESFGEHVDGKLGAAFLGGDTPGAEQGGGHRCPAEELRDQKAEAAGDDLSVAEGDADVGVLAQACDVADGVAVAAGGEGVVLAPQFLVGLHDLDRVRHVASLVQ
ncbi:hypothetical protein GCM10023220_00220 [Streptomyces ziwulingensis]|uniref:Uncharacterized protein n=1 Tax=Streptomyces ziwulingensis TaxID=1045501 RepID=A0ABP9AKU5_9ACTN